VKRRIENFHLASAEFEAAIRWEEERRNGLGKEFYDAVSASIELIEREPRIGTVIGGEG